MPQDEASPPMETPGNEVNDMYFYSTICGQLSHCPSAASDDSWSKSSNISPEKRKREEEMSLEGGKNGDIEDSLRRKPPLEQQVR